jgi:hypothetical protein
VLITRSCTLAITELDCVPPNAPIIFVAVPFGPTTPPPSPPAPPPELELDDPEPLDAVEVFAELEDVALFAPEPDEPFVAPLDDVPDPPAGPAPAPSSSPGSMVVPSAQPTSATNAPTHRIARPVSSARCFMTQA